MVSTPHVVGPYIYISPYIFIFTYIYIYIFTYIYIFDIEGFLEVAIESWPEWDFESTTTEFRSDAGNHMIVAE